MLTARKILTLTDDEIEKMRIPKAEMPLKVYDFYTEGLQGYSERTGKSLDEIIEHIVNGGDIAYKEHIIFCIKAYQHLKGEK